MTITRNFSTLANGAGSANNLSLGGATLGSNALAVTGTTAISKASAGDALTWTNGGATPKTGYLYSDSGVVAMFNVAGAGAGRNGIQISSTAVILDINAGANTANFTASGLGIGMTPSNVLDITQSQNAASQVKLLNSNGSSGAQSNFFASNGTNTAQFGIWGTGATTSGAVTAGNAFVYGDNGISYFTGGTHKWYISTNTEAMRLNTSGYLGIGTSSPGAPLEVSSSQTSYPTSYPMLKINNPSGVGQSALDFYINSTLRARFRADYVGNLSYVVNGGGHYFYTGGDSGVGTTAVTITGTALAVTGALSKGSGSFRIEHPLPSLSETHNLVHSFIEGPKCDLIYRGSVTLVAGTATINIDTDSTMTEGTFEVLCRNVQCFTTNESDWTPIKGSVSGNILTIVAQDNTSTADISWMVIGQRKDPHIISTEWTDDQGNVIVEPIKEVTPTP